MGYPTAQELEGDAGRVRIAKLAPGGDKGTDGVDQLQQHGSLFGDRIDVGMVSAQVACRTATGASGASPAKL